MKVAVSDSDGSLEAPVDQRFRLFPYFVIVETETMALESVQNSNKSSLRGAGIGAAQVFSNKGLEAVLTEAVRPNAMEVLSQAGIKISTGSVGSVRQSLEAFNRGELKEAPTAWYRGFYVMTEAWEEDAACIRTHIRLRWALSHRLLRLKGRRKKLSPSSWMG